jgi:hypothetical protein
MNVTPNTPATVLHALIERGYRLQKDPQKRPILTGMLEKVEAAQATGTGLELLPIEAAALADLLTYHDACRALGMRRTAEREASASMRDRVIVPFPGCAHHQPHTTKP